jgi:hypothetical protein
MKKKIRKGKDSMNNIKNKLFIYICICFFSLPVIFGEDLIEIKIDGEVYTNEYPKNLEDAYTLLDAIAYINNELDDTFIEYQKISEEEKNKLLEKISVLETYNKSLEEKINDIEKSNTDVKKYIDKEINKPTEWLILLSFGQVMNMENTSFGNRFSLGFLKNLHLLNLYAGSNLNTTIYYNTSNPKDIGLSLYLGMFIN